MVEKVTQVLESPTVDELMKVLNQVKENRGGDSKVLLAYDGYAVADRIQILELESGSIALGKASDFED